LNGDAVQRDYSPEYGEDKTPAYQIWNMSADYALPIAKVNATLQVGAENILDSYYSTYADWGNIPRMGRNIFTSLKINF
jgi:iron complex outermembrane receptor protein